MRYEGVYVWVWEGLTEHVFKAQNAVGHKLPVGAEVHHMDFNRLNNENSNLVVCPTRSYHRLLHRRTHALDACGNANWLKCVHCKKWDDPLALKIWKYGETVRAHHVICNRKYQKEKYHAKS